MNLKAILIPLCVATLAYAELSTHAHEITTPTKEVGSAAIAATNSEVFRNFVVQSGKNFTVESAMDFSGAAIVAVTILCPSCNTEAYSLGNSGLTLQARWLVLNADSYVTAESKAATQFLYWDAGSALFNVYGSHFHLVLQNKGTQSIAIQQLTIFRRVQ